MVDWREVRAIILTALTMLVSIVFVSWLKFSHQVIVPKGEIRIFASPNPEDAGKAENAMNVEVPEGAVITEDAGNHVDFTANPVLIIRQPQTSMFAPIPTQEPAPFWTSATSLFTKPSI